MYSRERLKSECEAGIEPRNLEEMNFQHVVKKKLYGFSAFSLMRANISSRGKHVVFLKHTSTIQLGVNFKKMKGII